MFLKLTYRNWSNLRVPSSTSWINMRHVEIIASYHGGSLLRMIPNAPYERCLLVEDKSPEELMEMMDKVRNAGCREVIGELGNMMETANQRER